MAAMTASVGAVLAATAILGWAQARHDRRRADLRRQGLAAARAGLALMTAVQQHRGMAAALLSGDGSFAARLADKQREVADALATLGEQLARAPELAAGARRLENVRAAWLQLREQVHGYGVEHSFTAHTTLVREVLYLLGDTGERAGLLEAREATVARLAEPLLLRLPLLAESIGQARALGAGFAAKGQCGAVGRIRLSFLGRRIRDNLAQAVGDLDAPALTVRAATCRQRVEALLGEIETELIGTDRITLPPDAYFRTATAAIDACLALWHATAEAVEQVLPAPRTALARI